MIRVRLLAFLIVLVITMVLGIGSILLMTDSLAMGGKEAEKIIEDEFSSIYNRLTAECGNAAVQLVYLSESLSRSIERQLLDMDIRNGGLQKHAEVFEEVFGNEISRLLLALEKTECSSVFMVIDATVNPSLETAQDSRAGIYICHTEPAIRGPETGKLYLRGFPALAYQNGMNLQSQWEMEFNIKDRLFYHSPIKKYYETRQPLSRLYYWNFEPVIPELGKDMIVCSVPLIDSEGNAFGVCGFEISSANYQSNYSPGNRVFRRIFSMFSTLDGSKLDPKNALLSGNYMAFSSELAGWPASFTHNKTLNQYDLYNGRKFVGLHSEIKLYPDDSPYADKRFAAALLLPKEEMRSVVFQMNLRLILICAVLLFLGIIVSLFISKMYTNQVTAAFVAITEARRAAETATQVKSTFLAKMSHEIRTPMNAITGMAELALRKDMPDIVREHILTIKQAGFNLLSIINDILDISKIESGKLEIVPAEYLFSSLINDVTSIIRTRVVDSWIRFVVNIDCNIPDALFGDETRIRQVLLNLLSNAVKYTENGFVSLAVTGETLGDTVTLAIEVADSGKGIKQEDIEKLFGEFVQFDLSINRGIEGAGLGLAITRNLVELMSGNILVSSEYGKGSIFTVNLPQKIRVHEKLVSVENPAEKSVLLYEQRKVYASSIQRTLDNLGVNCTAVCSYSEFCENMKRGMWPFVFVSFGIFKSVSEIIAKTSSQTKVVLLAEFGEVLADEDMHILIMPAHSISVANALNGITIDSTFSPNKKIEAEFTYPEARVLVVDDIETNLKVAEGLLLPYKIQVELCINGTQAIEAVKQNDYDLIFMDHMMPEMDGVETTAAIRALEGDSFKTIPIIALTANVVSGMKEMFMENGFSDFLEKPINISKLNEMLTRWIPKEKKRKITDYVPTTENGTLNFFIPDVDVKQGIAMTGGTEMTYRTVLSMFRKDVEKRLFLFEKFLKENNSSENDKFSEGKYDQKDSKNSLSAFITQVHALKSASASIGAAEASAQAAQLETAGKAGNMAFIQENLPGFTKKLAKLAEKIRIWEISIEEDDFSRAEKPDLQDDISFTAELPLLHELAAALETQKTKDIDRILDKLNQKLLDAETKEILEQISDQVLIAEFKSAVKTINEFISGKPWKNRPGN